MEKKTLEPWVLDKWREAQKDEQRFHIHYSAAGLGLLMTLQTLRQPTTGAEAAGPTWLWLTAIAALAVCLLLSGWSYWWDAGYYHAFLMDARDGSFREHPRWERFLHWVDIAVRATFLIGVVSSAAYFICQRASACLDGPECSLYLLFGGLDDLEGGFEGRGVDSVGVGEGVTARS